jgi:hypothetical protein
MAVNRESVFFHAFFDSPTCERYKLTRELSPGRKTVSVAFKRCRFVEAEDRYKWDEPIKFELPADQAGERETLVVAREKETGLERPPQLRKLFNMRSRIPVPPKDPEQDPYVKRVPLKRRRV